MNLIISKTNLVCTSIVMLVNIENENVGIIDLYEYFWEVSVYIPATSLNLRFSDTVLDIYILGT